MSLIIFFSEVHFGILGVYITGFLINKLIYSFAIGFHFSKMNFKESFINLLLTSLASCFDEGKLDTFDVKILHY